MLVFSVLTKTQLPFAHSFKHAGAGSESSKGIVAHQ